MVLVNDSVTVVLLGDWNKLYIQPDWIAKNVYEKKEIEIGVNGQGTDFNVTYRCDSVIIAPTQSQVIFTASDVYDDTLNFLTACVNNFLKKAITPFFVAYGFNCEFIDTDGGVFADVIDSMPDNSAIIEHGYEIKSAKVSRTLVKNSNILNVEMMYEGNVAKIHFNEHHGEITAVMPTISNECIKDFIRACSELVETFGYELEGEE